LAAAKGDAKDVATYSYRHYGRWLLQDLKLVG
jgi:hypothetical protein